MRAVSAVTLLGAVVLLSPSPEARSCTCTAPPVAQALAQAEDAFVASVTFSALDSDKEKRLLTFTVKRVFKGSAPAQVQVVTPLTESACGYTFHPGGVYLVFTRNIRGKRLTHLCAGNVPTTLQGPWPRELESGWTPGAPESKK